MSLSVNLVEESGREASVRQKNGSFAKFFRGFDVETPVFLREDTSFIGKGDCDTFLARLGQVQFTILRHSWSRSSLIVTDPNGTRYNEHLETESLKEHF